MEHDRGYDPDSDVISVQRLGKMLKYMTASFHAVGIEIYHDREQETGKVKYHIRLRLDNELDTIVRDVEIYDGIEYKFIVEAFKPFITEYADSYDSDFDSSVNGNV